MTLKKTTLSIINVHIRPELKTEFLNWQARLNTIIATFPGFVSLEVSSLQGRTHEWTIVQRFTNSENFSAWLVSQEHQEIRRALEQFLIDSPHSLYETESKETDLQGVVTEVFVTQVRPDKEKAYLKWIAEIHKVEAHFPGFQGVYIQSPDKGKENWITLLQFDNAENLNYWLSSKEREQVLRESKSLIDSLENYRLLSPYAGWFASIPKNRSLPPIWKQTMIVLLILFPIVMLEIKYLSPLTNHFNLSLATFIGNAISVSLIAYPFMPIAICYLGWWLSPQDEQSWSMTLLGIGMLGLLYAIEIAIFWMV